jgi:hypothetical protein
MIPARRQIENALIDVKLAIDESLADEDLNTFEAISSFALTPLGRSAGSSATPGLAWTCATSWPTSSACGRR